MHRVEGISEVLLAWVVYFTIQSLQGLLALVVSEIDAFEQAHVADVLQFILS